MMVLAERLGSNHLLWYSDLTSMVKRRQGRWSDASKVNELKMLRASRYAWVSDLSRRLASLALRRDMTLANQSKSRILAMLCHNIAVIWKIGHFRNLAFFVSYRPRLKYWRNVGNLIRLSIQVGLCDETFKTVLKMATNQHIRRF